MALPDGVPAAIGCCYPASDADRFRIIRISGLGRKLPALSAVLSSGAGDGKAHEW